MSSNFKARASPLYNVVYVRTSSPRTLLFGSQLGSPQNLAEGGSVRLRIPTEQSFLFFLESPKQLFQSDLMSDVHGQKTPLL